MQLGWVYSKEPLKPQVHLHYIPNSSFYLKENTLHLHHKTNQLMQFMEIFLFMYEAHKIHKYNVWQDAEFLILQASEIYRLVMTMGERVKYRTYNSELF